MYDNLKIDQKLLEAEYLARATCIHDHIDCLLERSIAFTVLVRKPAFCEDIKKVIFLKINRFLYKKRRTTGSRRSSVILCGDVEGTRLNRGAFGRPIMPHIHGYLVLSPQDFESWRGRTRELTLGIQKSLLRIREVGQSSKRTRESDVVVKPAFARLDIWLSYLMKAYPQAALRRAEFDPPSVYPYELDIRRGGAFADVLERKMLATRAELQRTLFTDDNNDRRE